MVREAYALLRQSIIHVEQDDIDFEEDDEDMADAAALVGGGANGHDVPMEDLPEDDELPQSANASSLLHGDVSSSDAQATGIAGVATATTTGSPAARRTAAQSVQPDGETQGSPVPALAPPKKKLRITCKCLYSQCGSRDLARFHSQQIHGNHEPLVSLSVPAFELALIAYVISQCFALE
jgi:DNA replication licensing factor MCM6